jgi:methyl-accepting chemotaxis protein
MNLTRQQLKDLYTHMDDVAKNSKNHAQFSKKSIIATNRVIYVSTVLGAILVVLILSEFILLNKAISRSLDSMSVINNQVGELRITMHKITGSMVNMGGDIEYLQQISSSINELTKTTYKINNYMIELDKKTLELGKNAHNINLHTENIGKNFSQINQSLGNISYSVNEVVRPIKQFIPMP